MRFNFMASLMTLSTLSRMTSASAITKATRKQLQGTAIQRMTRMLIIRRATSKNQLVMTGSTISPMLMSLEKRLSIRPTGLESKKETGVRKRANSILLWSF